MVAEEHSPLLWFSGLNVNENGRPGKKTGIVCTLSGKVNTPEILRQLKDEGMNIIRMNFSHGTQEYHGETIDMARKIFKNDTIPVAFALDTKGPEIRLGDMKDGEPKYISQGHEMVLTTEESMKTVGTENCFYVDYKNLPFVVKKGSLIYVDDGILSLEVLECYEKSVKVVAKNSHIVSSRKGVNLPYTPIDLPAVSEKDLQDLLFGVQKKIDIVFASFIRKAGDIQYIRAVLGEDGENIQIIAKIESYEGVKNFESILDAADGIMIARGDLGIEIPPEDVFVAQKKIIALCNRMGKPVICATQMLESMIQHPRPTRAEVSDVANAVLDGADCVMLSGETAAGDYPLESVRMMAKIVKRAEMVIQYSTGFEELCRHQISQVCSKEEMVAQAAVRAVLCGNAKCIVVFSNEAYPVALVAKYRPPVPIFIITKRGETARRLLLHRGCIPLYEPSLPIDAFDELIRWAVVQGRANNLIDREAGWIVVLYGNGKSPILDTLRVHLMN